MFTVFINARNNFNVLCRPTNLFKVEIDFVTVSKQDDILLLIVLAISPGFLVSSSRLLNTFKHLFHEIIIERLSLSMFYLFCPKTTALVNETTEKRKNTRDEISII